MTSRGSGERSQSETIGIVLVFGLVIAGSVVVVTFGASALGESEEALAIQRAEKAMTQFDSKAALVALGNTDVQSADLVGGSSGNFRTVTGSGWMNVTVRNTTDSSNNFHLVNQSLGALVYRQEPTTIAYQGGGVWRSTGNGSTMVSPPEFHFRNGTLTLPIVNVTDGSGLSEQARISHEETIQKFPDRGLADGDNPLDQHKVLLVVRSDYYMAWGRYFEARTDGVVEYDHDLQKAILTLKTPAGKRKLSNAISATASSGSLTMSGSGSAPARTDSYDSRIDEYSVSVSNDGNITIGGNVDLAGNAEVYGDIRAGGWVDCIPNNLVNGKIQYTDSSGTSISCGPTDGTEVIDGVTGTAPVNSHVVDTVAAVQADNDNGQPGADIDTGTNTIDFSGGTATLTPGDYYLTDLSLDDQTLILDTDGQTIRIAVRDYVDIEKASELRIEDDGQVKIYVKGEATEPDGFHFDMRNQGNSVPKVTTPGPIQNSTQLWIYGQDDLQASIEGSGLGQRPKFQGVLYAPAGTAGTSSVRITGVVYGGVVTGHVVVDTGGEVHFDKALQEIRTVPRDAKLVTITYLHVTVNRVRIG